MRILLVAALAAGCNLVSNDLTKTQVQLPIEQYMVDTSDHTNVKLPPSIPAVPCAADAVCCPGSCQGDGYQLACGPGGTCQATVTVTLVQPVDLSADATLAKAKSVADVTLGSIEYAVCNNSLSVAIPQIDLWLAPDAVTQPNTAMGAKKIGTIPMVPAHTDVTCPMDPMHPDPTTFAKVQLEPDAQATFTAFAKDFKTRFNVIASGTLVEKANQATPSGSLTVFVTGTAQASLSF